MTVSLPLPPVLNKSISSVDSDQFFQYRTKDLDTSKYCYKLGGQGVYGLDVSIMEDADINENEMSLTILYADGRRRDGVGDLLEVGGINTERHKLSPNCLFDHGKQFVLPIAMAEDPDTGLYCNLIDQVNKKGSVRAYFYGDTGKVAEKFANKFKQIGASVSDLSPETVAVKSLLGNKDIQFEHAVFCNQIFDLAAKRFLRGGSIGYQVLRAVNLGANMETGTPAGLHLLSTLMLEASLVVMPANMDTVTKKSFNVDRADAAREILCMGSVCGKSLSPYLIKSLDACVGGHCTKVISGYEGKGLETTPKVFSDGNDKSPEIAGLLSELPLSKIPFPHGANNIPRPSYRSHPKFAKSLRAKYKAEPGSIPPNKPPKPNLKARQQALRAGGTEEQIYERYAQSQKPAKPQSKKKALSAFDNTAGGALVPPAEWGCDECSAGHPCAKCSGAMKSLPNIGEKASIRASGNPAHGVGLPDPKKPIQPAGRPLSNLAQPPSETVKEPLTGMEAEGRDLRVPKMRREFPASGGTKSLKSLRQSYRKAKGLRRRVKGGNMGKSTMLIKAKDFDAAQEMANSMGCDVTHRGMQNGLVKMGMSGTEKSMDDLAKNFGVAKRVFGKKSLPDNMEVGQKAVNEIQGGQRNYYDENVPKHGSNNPNIPKVDNTSPGSSVKSGERGIGAVPDPISMKHPSNDPGRYTDRPDLNRGQAQRPLATQDTPMGVPKGHVSKPKVSKKGLPNDGVKTVRDAVGNFTTAAGTLIGGLAGSGAGVGGAAAGAVGGGILGRKIGHGAVDAANYVVSDVFRGGKRPVTPGKTNIGHDPLIGKRTPEKALPNSGKPKVTYDEGRTGFGEGSDMANFPVGKNEERVGSRRAINGPSKPYPIAQDEKIRVAPDEIRSRTANKKNLPNSANKKNLPNSSTKSPPSRLDGRGLRTVGTGPYDPNHVYHRLKAVHDDDLRGDSSGIRTVKFKGVENMNYQTKADTPQRARRAYGSTLGVGAGSAPEPVRPKPKQSSQPTTQVNATRQKSVYGDTGEKLGSAGGGKLGRIAGEVVHRKIGGKGTFGQAGGAAAGGIGGAIAGGAALGPLGAIGGAAGGAVLGGAAGDKLTGENSLKKKKYLNPNGDSKHMNSQAKAMPGEMPPEVDDYPEDMGAPDDLGAPDMGGDYGEEQEVEKYSAQVLRRLHQDAGLLLEQYDEIAEMLEHDEIGGHLRAKLEGLASELDEIEALFEQHHPDAAALEGAGRGEEFLPEEGMGLEGEEGLPEEGMEGEEEMGDELPPEEGEEGLEDERAIEETVPEDELPSEDADSEEEELPTPEDAVKGMRTKDLKRRLVKALRNQYGKKFEVCPKCGEAHAPGECAEKSMQHKGLDETTPGEEANREQEGIQNESTTEHEGPLNGETMQEKVDEKFKPHEYEAVENAHSVLAELEKTTNFHDDHRRKSAGAAALLKQVEGSKTGDGGIKALLEGIQFKDGARLGEEEAMKAIDDSEDKSEKSYAAHREAVQKARAFLEKIFDERAFGEPHRAEAMKHRLALEAALQAMDPALEGADGMGVPGELADMEVIGTVDEKSGTIVPGVDNPDDCFDEAEELNRKQELTTPKSPSDFDLGVEPAQQYGSSGPGMGAKSSASLVKKPGKKFPQAKTEIGAVDVTNPKSPIQYRPGTEPAQKFGRPQKKDPTVNATDVTGKGSATEGAVRPDKKFPEADKLQRQQGITKPKSPTQYRPNTEPLQEFGSEGLGQGAKSFDLEAIRQQRLRQNEQVAELTKQADMLRSLLSNGKI